MSFRWEDLVPKHVAVKQRMWEKRQVIVRAKKSEMCDQHIARMMQVSLETVVRVWDQYLLDQRPAVVCAPYVRIRAVSPVEMYCRDTYDLRKLAELER
jgi:hypothetical protein